jgi:uncharacterized protein (TIGR03435 family)
MKKLKLPMIALAALAGSTLFAQDITGTWQGTLNAGGRDLRVVYKISKADTGGLKAVMYSIDQGGQGIPVATVTLQGAVVKMTIPAIGGTFEGKLGNTDATTITGSWTQGPTPLPLELTHATDKTAWTIPEPPPPPVPMAADAVPSFEVATIKPSVPDSKGIGIRMNGRNFSTLNTSLIDLITFAYGLHARQVTGAPGWLETDKYDIAAVPDRPGMPNDKQVKAMIQKLLADRFKLTFHHDKKELSVFLITVGKTGPKITKNETNPNGLPGLGLGGLGRVSARNATIADFAGLMQGRILDRPVVDQTGLAGRFDFTLTWTPDETQYGGAGAKGPPPSDNGTAPPDLFTAMQEQLGLKIESTKAPADVLVIDHVEKPSDN